MSQKIQIRKGTKAQLDTITLDFAELGYCTDTKQLWVGNGVGNTLIAKEIAEEGVQFGTTALASGDTSKTITYDKATNDTNYALFVNISNTVDTDPSLYAFAVTSKTTTGFEVSFSDPIDSDNYKIDWTIVQRNVISVGLQGTNYEYFRLNNDEAGTPTEDCGIVVERGTEADARLKWDETTDKWYAGDDNNMNEILTTDSVIDCGTFI